MIIGEKLAEIDLKMSFSILVISDIDRFAEMKEFWDRELNDKASNPFIFSNMLIEHYELSQKLGYRAFLVVFLSAGKILGFAPLVVKSRFGFKQAFNLHEYVYMDFFVDSYREFFINILVNLLFGRFKCKSIELTFEEGSENQTVLEKICRRKGLRNYKVSTEGEAIITTDGNLKAFQNSLSRKRQKNLRKIARKINALGSWRIYETKLDSNSTAKIWEVEKHSWKTKLQGKEKAIKNGGLQLILSVINQTNKSIFDSNVWFLEIENLPIAYQLVLNRKRTDYFVKTSFDSRFRKASPGIFLINNLIERGFREKNSDKIDFISNQPFMKNWKTVVKNRTKIIIEPNLNVSKICRLLLENQFSYKIIEFLDSLKWKKLYR